MDYDDKAYYDQDDAVICIDRTTGEPYTLDADGTRNYAVGF